MRKTLSILLAFQVLLSSMSFNLGMHFCGDRLQSFSLFDKATPCEHASSSESSSCPFHPGMNTVKKKKGCCDDKEVKIEGQDHETIVSTTTIDLIPDYKFLAAYALVFVQRFTEIEVVSPEFYNYKPPLIRLNIPVFLQTFLI